ncbi:hypothetical protein [Mycoplasmopsis felis]|uniref:hypothetical protein n=1 Tax=Mycoplasmopsis felis TaxID=33923 RepID=UPI0021AF311E|nr:hypothetical protein [Mycoplasmopsis felis]UWV84380.1 hypothetical protein NWE58_02895 [Mycoplasmopsis felis]
MNLILEKLQKKKERDKKTLKLYSILDAIISTIVSFLSIASISTAIYVLVILVQLSNKNPDVLTSVSFVLLLVLIIFILLSFILTIVLSIMKHNDKTVKYKRILNTIKYLEIKHNSNLITDKDLDTIIDTLWEKGTKKQKLAISEIIKSELKKGAK